MPKFFYKAKKGPQEITEGTLEAETRDVAIAKIDQMGYVPIRVVQEYSQSVQATHPLRSLPRVKSRDLTIFTEQLASLIKSKVGIFEAINILSTQTEHTVFKEIISSLSKELKEGKTLSKALSQYPQVFSPLYINMIHSGESGGILGETLVRLAKFRQEEEEIRSKISAALAYPIFIITIA